MVVEHRNQCKKSIMALKTAQAILAEVSRFNLEQH